MKLKIKLSSGKKLNLTGDEFTELMGYKEKPVYCLVFHYWFQDTKNWDIQYIQADNEKEARKEALVIKEKTESTFNQCAFKIIKMFKGKDDK